MTLEGDQTIACIGAGYWGKNLVRKFHDLRALSCIHDNDPAARASLQAQYPDVRMAVSVEAVLADPTIRGVVIATPAATHGRLVEQSLHAGKDVLVEKPLCLSVDEAHRLVRLAADQNRILMVGHLLWYHPAVLKLRELVQRGELGRIQYVYSNRLNLGKIRREENILWSFAPHDISVILGLLNEPPDAIVAQGGNYLHERIADVTVTMLAFPSGVKAHIFVSWLHPYKEQKLIVVGDRKMAVFDDLEADNKLVLYPHVINWQNQMPVASRAEAEVVAFEKGEPLLAECVHFLECMRSRQIPRTDGREALQVLQVLDACQAALEPKVASARPVHTAPPPSYFAHDSAFIDTGAEIGYGTTIWHVSHVLKNSRIGKNCRIGQNVVIGPNAVVGNGVKIQNNVSVYEGVTLEDDVFCGPSMVFTNVVNPRSEITRMHELRPTIVRRGATLGANCTVVCGVTIGRYAFVGAGAVVTRDVPPFALVLGNPARITGWKCVCGHDIHFSAAEGPGTCSECHRSYSRSGTEVTLHGAEPVVA